MSTLSLSFFQRSREKLRQSLIGTGLEGYIVRYHTAYAIELYTKADTLMVCQIPWLGSTLEISGAIDAIESLVHCDMLRKEN